MKKAKPKPHEELRQVYANDIARRLILHVRKRMEASRHKGRLHPHAWTLSKLALRIGMPYQTLRNNVVLGNNKLSLDTVDAILHAEELSVLDLLSTPEIASAVAAKGERQGPGKWQMLNRIAKYAEGTSTRGRPKSVPTVPLTLAAKPTIVDPVAENANESEPPTVTPDQT